MTPARRSLIARASGVAVSIGLVCGIGSCSSESGSVDAFCEVVADLPPLASAVAGFADAHPAELARRLDDAEAAYAELRRAAPGSIDGEVDSVVDLVEEIVEAVRENPEDREAAADRIRAAMDEHPDVATASAAVIDFAEENCGVALDPSPADEPAEPGDEPEAQAS